MWKPIALLLGAVGVVACGPESGLGFRLPEGNAEHGRAAFVALRCNSCHDIEGFDLGFQGAGAAHVTLGGRITRVKTYGELVTSIINPSHRISPRYPEEDVAVNGESLMSKAFLNEVMTVQQLIDLVAFLQATYQVIPPPVPGYWYVYP